MHETSATCVKLSVLGITSLSTFLKSKKRV